MKRLNWAAEGPRLTVAEANACRNEWIAGMEYLPADHPAYIARLHLIRTHERLRIAAIEGRK
ncbi:hypothetical protein [Deinococcus humi]|uniref:Uncharacterized protein n=1 Tax=Deinococcus humi TaxID=662880 RepID=A0A7W8NE30_9DEIO|nr:hypothetical protein [Deinococcus humi]MBB5361378.1 hypothetical protein [Deinococcus humi]GGO19783.1 hypothetical protein GCM10008949_04410 [Deinococcus humi]